MGFFLHIKRDTFVLRGSPSLPFTQHTHHVSSFYESARCEGLPSFITSELQRRNRPQLQSKLPLLIVFRAHHAG